MPLNKSKLAKGNSRKQSSSKASNTVQGSTKGQYFLVSTSKPTRRLQVEEGVHDDDEEIHPGRFPFKELIPGWQDLDPNTKNPALDKKFAKSHHVPDGGGKTKRDFENFTFAFCLKWEWDAEEQMWYRCYNQFLVNSPQCGKHPRTAYKDGCNQIWRHMKESRVGNYGMIKNRHIKEEQRPLTTLELKDRRRAQMIEEVERRALIGEDRIAVWAELTEQEEEDDRIAQKIEREAARAKSVSANDETDSSAVAAGRKGDPRKTFSKSDGSRADLDAKAARNPNQRGKRAAKGATHMLHPAVSTLTPIAED
jgi:hypothetical protein